MSSHNFEIDPTTLINMRELADITALEEGKGKYIYIKKAMDPPPNRFTHRGPHQTDDCDIIYHEGMNPVIDLHGMTKKEAEDW